SGGPDRRPGHDRAALLATIATRRWRSASLRAARGFDGCLSPAGTRGRDGAGARRRGTPSAHGGCHIAARKERLCAGDGGALARRLGVLGRYATVRLLRPRA